VETVRLGLLTGLLLLTAPLLTAQTVLYDLPVKGVPGADYYLVNFPDHDSTKGIRDFACGSYTYDAHQGTDFVLKDFARMDSGVTVLAAAAGTVTHITDGLFDRSKATNTAQFGNYISVLHSDGSIAFYAHLRKGSMLVAEKDKIVASQPLALVGSSGNSTDPHLHFELRKSNVIIDPWQGRCGAPTSLWKTQFPYPMEREAIDAGLINFEATIDTLRERPATFRRFGASDPMVCFWTHLLSIRVGDTSMAIWRAPSGTVYRTERIVHDAGYRYLWWWFSLPLSTATPKGSWSVEYWLNGRKLRTEQFEVGAAPLSAAVPAAQDRATLLVYPSPAYRGASLMLHYSASGDGAARVRVYDMLGSLRLETRTDARGTCTLRTLPLPPGMYRAVADVAGRPVASTGFSVLP
jgi:hypothetical protein